MLGNGIKLKINVCADFLRLFDERRQLPFTTLMNILKKNQPPSANKYDYFFNLFIFVHFY